jgi:hypothetical protein
MFANAQPQPRRPDQPYVPDTRTDSRLRTLAQRIPRLAVNTDFRVIPWSERRSDRWDRDYVLRLPVLDLSRMQANRIMNPAPVRSVNPEAVVNNPRPPADNQEDYNLNS